MTGTASDIKAIFAGRGVDRIPTSELIAALVDIDSHPWAEWKGGNSAAFPCFSGYRCRGQEAPPHFLVTLL